MGGWRFTARAVVVLLLLTALPCARDARGASTLERIREHGTIVFAYRDGAAPFSFRSRDGVVQGYSAELCARVADAIRAQLGLRDLSVQWVPVDADARFDVVATGRADAECGTSTITLSRLEKVDFSLPIFVDGGTLAVRAPSKVQRLADLDRRRIAVIAGTTTERALRAALSLAGVTATLVPVVRPEDGAAALRHGAADAYAADRMVLTRLTVSARDMRLLRDDFSFEPYGIVVRRDDPDFRLAVNRALVATFREGAIDAIFQRWLAPIGRPSALLNAMFYLNALPE